MGRTLQILLKLESTELKKFDSTLWKVGPFQLFLTPCTSFLSTHTITIEDKIKIEVRWEEGGE